MTLYCNNLVVSQNQCCLPQVLLLISHMGISPREASQSRQTKGLASQAHSQLCPVDLSSMDMFPITSKGRMAARMPVRRLPRWEKPGNEVGGRKMVTVCGTQGQDKLNKVKIFGFSFQLRMSLNYIGQKQGEPGKDHSLLEFFLFPVL